MKFKVGLPIEGTITQTFSQNANFSYENAGLMGHPAIDIVSYFGDAIKDSIVGYNKKYVYSILNKNNPDLMKYRAVCQIVEADDGVFEVIYGHCNDILCSIGPTTTHQSLATEGNTGSVFVGNEQVTEEQKENGSKAGTHVHFQIRRLRKSKIPSLNSLTTDGIHDFIDPDGYHFDIPNYYNGFNGCIDPMQFIGLQNNYQFKSNMKTYSVSTEVYQLQKRLVRLGFGSFAATGFFGDKTKKAVILYQEANDVDQIGEVGPLTRTKLNS